jgi:membrane associated rhomboid family serine protease
MKNYQYLIPDGEDYQVKQFYGFAVIIVVLWIFIALAMVIWSDYKKNWNRHFSGFVDGNCFR